MKGLKREKERWKELGKGKYARQWHKKWEGQRGTTAGENLSKPIQADHRLAAHDGVAHTAQVCVVGLVPWVLTHTGP